MNARTIGLTALATIAVACSGYEGGGDVRIAPLADSGASTIIDGGPSSTSDASSPRDGGSDGSQPARGGVIAYYPLDGNVSDLTTDASHLDLNQANGTFTGGQVGQSLGFSNTGPATIGASRSQLDDVLAFGDRDFTIQAWIASSGSIGTGLGTRQFGVPANDGWMLYADQSSVVFQSNDPRGALSTSVGTSGAFRHVVARRKNGTMAIFVNGSMAAARDNYPSIGPERVFVIQRSAGLGDAPTRIDEIVIWSRALDESEITANYTRGQSGQPPVLTQ